VLKSQSRQTIDGPPSMLSAPWLAKNPAKFGLDYVCASDEMRLPLVGLPHFYRCSPSVDEATAFY
jgi:hypothetical protein